MKKIPFFAKGTTVIGIDMETGKAICGQIIDCIVKETESYFEIRPIDGHHKSRYVKVESCTVEH